MGLAHFVEFRTRGTSSDQHDPVTTLGSNRGGFPINAMQLHYRLIEHDPVYRVRWRREIVEEVAWDSVPQDGRFLPFFRQSRRPDHPPPWEQPYPDLYDIDLPGITPALCLRRSIELSSDVLLDPVGRASAEGTRGQSRPEAEELVWIINFVQWVEVAFGPEAYRRESDPFRWSSIVRAKWTGEHWIGAPGSLIARGHRFIPPDELIPEMLGLVV